MTEIIRYLPERALTLSGAPQSGAGFTAEFFLSGTTTATTVYQDEDLTIPHPTPIVADATGTFPQAFVSGAFAVKAVIKTAAGITYATVDPCLAFSLDISAASSVSFSPTSDILATNVQEAIEEVAGPTIIGLRDMGTGVGMVAQISDDGFAKRTIAGTADQITVTNGDGVAGAPTIAAVVASEAEAQTGTNATKLVTPLRVRQAMNAAGSAPIFACRAWVNFHGVPTNGTYSRTGNTVTVTMVGHGMSNGMIATLDYTTGGGTDGAYAVTFVNVDTFTVQDPASGATSGNVTRNAYTRAAGNVASVTRASAGVYAVNFTSAMSDAFYAMQITAGDNGAPTTSIIGQQATAAPTSSVATVGVHQTGTGPADMPNVYVTIHR